MVFSTSNQFQDHSGVNVDCLPLAEIVTDWLATHSNSILLPCKLDPYGLVWTKAKSVKICEQGIPNIISSDWPSLAPQSGKDTWATSPRSPHQSKFSDSLLEEYSTTDLPTGTGDARRWNAPSIIKATRKVGYDAIYAHTKMGRGKCNSRLWIHYGLRCTWCGQRHK